MFNILVAHLRYMHQAVLMHTDIHESAKVDHVPDCSLKDHSLFQILHVQHVRTQDRPGHLVTRITARLFQLLHDILQGDLAHAQLCCQLLIIMHLAGNTGHSARCQIFG